jgi:hypothetical protein
VETGLLSHFNPFHQTAEPASRGEAQSPPGRFLAAHLPSDLHPSEQTQCARFFVGVEHASVAGRWRLVVVMRSWSEFPSPFVIVAHGPLPSRSVPDLIEQRLHQGRGSNIVRLDHGFEKQ